MIKTEQTGGWEAKVNFIDSNDLFVGYDMSQHCCESADYTFLTEPRARGNFADVEIPEYELDITDYIFDPDYFQDVEDTNIDTSELYGECVGQVFFRLTAQGKPDLYLTLYNAHNGYYSHGFKTNVGGVTGYSL